MSYRILIGVLCFIQLLGARSASAQLAQQQEPSARLVLAADVEGRFLVRNAAQELIAEVYKPAGRALTLNLAPGTYQVRVEREKTTMIATVNVADNTEVVLDRQQLGAVVIESGPPQPRGEVLPYAVTSRNRFDVRWGASGHGSSNHVVVDGIDSSNMMGGIRYTRYFKESLAATFSIEGSGGRVGTMATNHGIYDGVSGIVSFPVGVRWNPLTFGRQHDGIKPFVAFSAGPVFGDMVADYAGRRFGDDIRSSATIGGFAGGGIDFHAGRTCVLGVEGGYNWMGDFDVPIGGTSNYSGPTVSINLGFMWGRGSTPQP